MNDLWKISTVNGTDENSGPRDSAANADEHWCCAGEERTAILFQCTARWINYSTIQFISIVYFKHLIIQPRTMTTHHRQQPRKPRLKYSKPPAKSSFQSMRHSSSSTFSYDQNSHNYTTSNGSIRNWTQPLHKSRMVTCHGCGRWCLTSTTMRFQVNVEWMQWPLFAYWSWVSNYPWWQFVIRYILCQFINGDGWVCLLLREHHHHHYQIQLWK